MRRIPTRVRAACRRVLAQLLQPSNGARTEQVAKKGAAIRAEIGLGGMPPELHIDASSPAAAFWRATAARPDPARAGFAVTSDLEMLPLSASMAGRRVVAVVMFGREEFSAAERVVRARIAPNRAAPQLRDCIETAINGLRAERDAAPAESVSERDARARALFKRANSGDADAIVDWIKTRGEFR